MITNCPRCKTNLKETEISYRQNGEMVYKIDIDSQGDLIWEQDEFYEDITIGTFYCRECGQDLDLTEEKVIKILS